MVLVGWNRNPQQVSEAGSRSCANCHHETRHILTQEKVQLTLFFVPVAGRTRPPQMVCTVCSYAVPLAASDAAAIVQAQIHWEQVAPETVQFALRGLYENPNLTTMSAPAVIVTTGAHGLAGAALVEVSQDHADWRLDPDTSARVIRVLSINFVLMLLEDPALRTYLAEWIDCKPSEVESRIWLEFRDRILSADEQGLADGLVAQARDASGYPQGLAHGLLWASGRNGLPSEAEVQMWSVILERYARTLVAESAGDALRTLARYESQL